MFKTAVLAGLVLLDDIKPRPVNTISRAQRHISEPVPRLVVVPDAPKVRKPVARRKKHVCGWTNDVVWAVFSLGLILGAFIMHCI